MRVRHFVLPTLVLLSACASDRPTQFDHRAPAEEPASNQAAKEDEQPAKAEEQRAAQEESQRADAEVPATRSAEGDEGAPPTEPPKPKERDADRGGDPEQKPSDKAVYKKKTVIDFSDVTIEGELVKPEGSYSLNRKKPRESAKAQPKSDPPPSPPPPELDPDFAERTRIVDDRPVGAMLFRNYGVNPTVDTAAERTSTFSVDVDTASYSLARGYLDRGYLPAPDGVRIEEFINAFDYGYQPPEQEPFSLSMEVVPSPNRKGYHVLQLGLKGQVVGKDQRKPANLIFVIDTSGSMQIESRLELVKRALAILVGGLTENDTVGIVAYGSKAYAVLQPTRGSEKDAILSRIGALSTDGSTDVQSGLKLGYQMASLRAKKGVNSRIILCSDGVANNGIATEADAIFNTVRSEASQGIAMTAVGFGMGNYNDVLMERLADQGDGFYAYVDKLAEAQRIFAQALTGTLQVIAKDAKIQVEFNPDSVVRYRLLGYENRHLQKRDFDNDKVDAGEIGAGHSVTALYEVKVREGSAPLGLLRIRYKAPEGGASKLREWQLPRSVMRPSLQDSSAGSRLALVTAGFAEKLRGSYWARNLTYDDLLALHSELPASLSTRPEVRELRGLIEKARALDRRGDRFEALAPISRMDFDTLPVLK